MATIVPLALLATRPGAARSTPPAATRSPEYSLTDAEAIAEFERLNELRLRAYEDRDVTLVPRIYTSDSPVADRVVKEINDLVRRNVTTVTRFRTQKLVVAQNQGEEIRIRQVALVDASFFSSTGDEISIDAPVERQAIEWTLQVNSGVWKIHDAVVTSAKPVGEDSDD
ncbi:MAG TPA: hypothetical protein VG318_17155 [Actinomycetota bacterium]|nr:hypothetical protein [Actinomycetota bacterium]